MTATSEGAPPRRWRKPLWLIAVSLLLAGAGVAYTLMRDGDEAGLTAAYVDGAPVPGLRVTPVDGADARALSAGSDDVSPVYEVSAPSALARDVALRFDVPEDLPDADRSRLFVATRDRADEAWTIERGTLKGNEYILRTDHFSEKQLRRYLPDFDVPDLKEIQENVLGTRARDPECDQTPPDMELRVESPGNENAPLVAACVQDEGPGGSTLLHLANKRAVALEATLPEGATLVSTTDGNLSEAVWARVNDALPSGTVLIPSGGSAVIRITALPSTVDLVVDSSMVTVDVLIGTAVRVGSAAQKEGAELARLAECAYEAADPELSPSGLIDVYQECARHLRLDPKAVLMAAVFGAAETVTGIVDSVKALLGSRASVTLEGGTVRAGPPPYTFTSELEAGDGSTMRIELTVEGLQPAVDRPGTGGEIRMCDVDTEADAMIPASVTVENTTDDFDRDISTTMVWGSDASDDYAGQPIIISSEHSCGESELGERVAKDGPVMWTALEPGATGHADFDFLIKEYYSPENPDGDPTVVSDTDFAFAPYTDESGRWTPTCLSGPGINSANYSFRLTGETSNITPGFYVHATMNFGGLFGHNIKRLPRCDADD